MLNENVIYMAKYTDFFEAANKNEALVRERPADDSEMLLNAEISVTKKMEVH